MAPSTPFPSPTVFTLQRPHPRASLPRQPRILGPGREGGDRQTYLVRPSPPPASEAGSSLIEKGLTTVRTDLREFQAFHCSWALVLGSFHPFCGEIVLECRCDQGTPGFRPFRGSLVPSALPRRMVGGLLHRLYFRLSLWSSPCPGLSTVQLPASSSPRGGLSALSPCICSSQVPSTGLSALPPSRALPGLSEAPAPLGIPSLTPGPLV